MQNQQNKKTVKYPLAKAGRRILAKVIDIAIIGVIVVALGFAIFCTDPNFEWNKELDLDQKWRFGLFVTLVGVLFYGLMLLLPCLWNKTIGMKAVNLSYHKRQECNYSWSIFKHELFIWEIVVIIAFAMGWTLSFLNQHQINSLLQGANAPFVWSVPENIDQACYYAGVGFSCFYSICVLFLVAIIIATCITSGKPTFHDKYSNILVIYKKKLEDKYVPYNSKKEDDIKAPGVISKESLEEIDNI